MSNYVCGYLFIAYSLALLISGMTAGLFPPKNYMQTFKCICLGTVAGLFWPLTLIIFLLTSYLRPFS